MTKQENKEYTTIRINKAIHARFKELMNTRHYGENTNSLLLHLIEEGFRDVRGVK